MIGASNSSSVRVLPLSCATFLLSYNVIQGMVEGLVTISARIPRSMYRTMDELVKQRGYASRTELLREMIRQEVLRDILSMQGALKGKVKMKESVFAMRRRMWRTALKKAGGDPHKASEIMEADKKERLRGFRL